MLIDKALRQGIAATVLLCVLLCLAGPVRAQGLDEVILVPDDTVFPPVPPPLNEKCVVAVLNRVAQVRPDGTWTVQNVPSNFGMVRARATCVSNSTTWGAESDLFTVPPNGIVAVGELKFEELTPIPTALRVTTPSTTLTTAGATVQLSVIATLSDGSTRDATAASVGTNYTSSNPAVATVSANGVVTAVSGGPVLVSVTHEGVLGLIRLQVALSSGDTDRDGIPDDIEQANGLNPNDPVDGFLDADGDGLTNKQELIDFGTNFRVADTDGDTIPDGEEVQAGVDGFVTNPLLRDTDGDGSDDAAEIVAGSDPTDPASRPVLVAVEVSPTNFILTVNTIIGEASQKLTVTGRRADGSTVNLTADPGTNYTSSDLTVCNFGTEKGRVFASNNGTCTITVTNGSLSVQSSITVRTFAPVSLSFVSIPGFANNVDVSGDYAYVAAGATGLQVVDVSNPTTPTLVSSENTPGNANDVVVVEDLAYVADGSSGLQIIDISDPLDPLIVKTVDTPGVAQDVAVKDNLVLVADGSAGLQIIDVTDPATAKLLSSIDTAGTAKGVAVSQDLPRAVVADGSGGIRVINLTDPTSPVIIGSVSTGGNARDVALSGNFAFVADFSRSFTVVDLSNPTAPVVRASTPSATGGLLTDVVQAGRFAFGADVFFVNGVPIIDVSTPATPIPRAILNFSDFGGDDNGTGIAVDGTFVYLTAEQGTITENGTTGNTRLYIGRYLVPEDAAGIAPTVSITSPASGETVIEGAPLPITVAATDDVTVAAVNLLVNGILVSTDTTAPYQFTLTVPTGVSSLTLGAAAVDVGGNMGRAQDVMVNVIPDPLTTVIGRVLAQGGNPVAGATVTCAEVSALTGVDGIFSIPAVPTITGAIRCTAVFVTPQGETLGGTSPRAVFPTSGGVTDVGDIVVVPGFVPGTGPLYPGPVFPASGGPVSVAMADLNGDQIADLVTANDTLDGVAVLLGNGNGTFQSPQRFVAGTNPRSVAVGDLNGDGIADIVVANIGSQDVSVLRGNGNGTFQTQQRFTVGTGAFPRAVAVADLNGDGRQDVVTANGANDVSVLLGNGNGTLQPPQRFAAGTSPQFVAARDLNGDGSADVVVANSASNDISVLLGNTNGTLQAQQRFVVGAQPQSVAVADLNGDTIADLVSANQSSQNVVSVLLGNGNGTFQTQQQFAVGTSPRSVAVADLNGDGRADVVTANFLVSDQISVSVLLGNGNGTFQAPQRFGVGGAPDSLAVGELNGDGMVDVVTASQAADAVSVLLGNGDGTLLAQRRFAMGGSPFSVAVADFNGDTIVDLVTANGGNPGNVSVVLGNGDGTFQAQRLFSMGIGPRDVAVADLNDDGIADIVTANVDSNNVSVRLGNGNGTFQSARFFAVGTGPISVAVGDVNNDDMEDIVAVNGALFSNNISVLLGNGNGTFQTQRVLAVGGVGSLPSSVEVRDLNGDGIADVVTVIGNTNNVSVLLSNGDGTFQAPRLFATPCSSVAIADLNGDTIVDLVTAGLGVSILLGNGDGTFRPEQRFAADLGGSSVAVADLNGDGTPDVVTTSSGGRNSVSVLLGNGDGTFRAEQRFAAGVGAQSVAVADFNGDGAPDLVTANVTSADVSVLLQQ